MMAKYSKDHFPRQIKICPMITTCLIMFHYNMYFKACDENMGG